MGKIKQMFNSVTKSAARTLSLGFAFMIIIGAVLLCLPISNRDGEFLNFLDAVFTACSATCVTGLVVCDTWSQFTGFGQAVILVLIQIGGLGFMTFSLLLAMVLKKPIGLRERGMLMETVSTLQLGGIVRFVRRLLFGTLIVESAGALLLYIRFCPLFGPLKGLWYAVFHSISAFCNAGFDLMGVYEPYASLTAFVTDPLINLTITALILIGGIGFIVWDDVVTYKFNLKKYSLHSKVTLAVSAALITLGTALFYVLEGNYSMAGMNPLQRILASFFQAITPRTAGFNTIDLTKLSSGGSFLTILFMIVGAGVGSTGGGIKITTFAVLLLTTVSVIRRREDVEVFKRRLPTKLVSRSVGSVGVYFSLAIIGTIIILTVQNLPLKDALFEVFSAVSTVGLSTGITRALLPVSRLVLIALMYCGRLGSLTLFMAFMESRKQNSLRYPEDRLIVG